MSKLRRMLADPHSDRTGTLCHRCPFPVSNPTDARLGLGAFNPAEDHLGAYRMGSAGTDPLDRSIGQMIRIRPGDECSGTLSPGEVAPS